MVRWQQEPQERYQLVHDYLVEPIRRKYNADYQQKFTEMGLFLTLIWTSQSQIC